MFSAQPCEVFSMHQIGADQSNQYEEAVFDLGHVLQEAQHQEGDQRQGCSTL